MDTSQSRIFHAVAISISIFKTLKRNVNVAIRRLASEFIGFIFAKTQSNKILHLENHLTQPNIADEALGNFQAVWLIFQSNITKMSRLDDEETRICRSRCFHVVAYFQLHVAVLLYVGTRFMVSNSGVPKQRLVFRNY